LAGFDEEAKPAGNTMTGPLSPVNAGFGNG
jgi:hypothetical protein